MWSFIELYLSSTMESILAYASERLTRRTYQKLLSKSEDAAAVKALSEQLTHAFHVFEVGLYPDCPLFVLIGMLSDPIKRKLTPRSAADGTATIHHVYNTESGARLASWPRGQ